MKDTTETEARIAHPSGWVPVDEYVRVVKLSKKDTRREGLSLILFALAWIILSPLAPPQYAAIIYLAAVPAGLVGLVNLVWARAARVSEP